MPESRTQIPGRHVEAHEGRFHFPKISRPRLRQSQFRLATLEQPNAELALQRSDSGTYGQRADGEQVSRVLDASGHARELKRLELRGRRQSHEANRSLSLRDQRTRCASSSCVVSRMILALLRARPSNKGMTCITSEEGETLAGKSSEAPCSDTKGPVRCMHAECPRPTAGLTRGVGLRFRPALFIQANEDIGAIRASRIGRLMSAAAAARAISAYHIH